MLATIFGIFGDKQVRFFKVTGELCRDEKTAEMTCHDGKSSNEKIPADDPTLRRVISPEKSNEIHIKYTISNLPPHYAKYTHERIGLPLSDFSEAIGYDLAALWKMLQRNPRSFEGYWTMLPIPDSLGRMQNTIILFEEAVVGLTMKLQETRLKNPLIEDAVIRFKRWVMELIPAIRRGEIRPVRILAKIGDAITEYHEAIQRQGYARSEKMKELQEKYGVSHATVYRRCKALTGGKNLPTKSGEPKKSPSFKGVHKMPLEAQKIIDAYNADPCLSNKDIWQKSGTKYSYGHTNLVLREYKKHKKAA